MNISQIKYFIAVAETKSFTKAGQQNYISQTAISQQMQLLEDELGCKLIDRSIRPLKLTNAGKTFLKEAKAILKRMNSAIIATKEASSGTSGILRIGYTKGYERSSLSSLILKFHHLYQNILISCYRKSSDELEAGLINDEYDLIFTWDSTELAKKEAYGSLLYERVPLVMALYNSHPLAQRKSIKRSELDDENIIYMSPSSTPGTIGDLFFMDLYHKAGIYNEPLFHTSDFESVLMMVSSEQGISILPDYCTRKLDNAENLIFVPMEGEGEYENITLLYKKSNDNEALFKMMEMIRKEKINR